MIANSFLIKQDTQKEFVQEESFLEKTNEPEIEEEIIKDNFEVTYVVDGDTVEIDTGERVRLICIDTPERGEEGYNEAKEYLKDLVLNKEVKLEKDISDTDRYDRLLRYIYLEDGTFVNELLVKKGYAEAYPYNPDVTLCPVIEEAESYAKDKEIGIWEIKIEIDLVEETPTEESSSTQSSDCSSNIYNCGDFSTHAEAQAVFDSCGGTSNDVHRLDGDEDGIACESLP